MNPCVVLMGPPGSGKTSLAQAVADKLEVQRISSGDIARRLAQTDSSLDDDLVRGEWGPELAIRSEILSLIEECAATRGACVLEGFPRNMAQLALLEGVPGIHPLYFVLECDPIQCVRRLVRRGRKGDHPDAIATRWKGWITETLPTVGLLMSELILLDASMPVEDLVQKVMDECKYLEQV